MKKSIDSSSYLTFRPDFSGFPFKDPVCLSSLSPSFGKRTPCFPDMHQISKRPYNPSGSPVSLLVLSALYASCVEVACRDIRCSLTVRSILLLFDCTPSPFHWPLSATLRTTSFKGCTFDFYTRDRLYHPSLFLLDLFF